VIAQDRARQRVHAMNIKYFQDTDTLYIEFKPAEVAESKDLDENTVLDLDQSGNILGITVEHASLRADIPRFSYEQVAA
jgi:uncharacterized protein YuzE